MTLVMSLLALPKKLSTTIEAEVAHNIASYIKYMDLSADTIIASNWFSNYMEPAHLVCLSEEKKELLSVLGVPWMPMIVSLMLFVPMKNWR